MFANQFMRLYMFKSITSSVASAYRACGQKLGAASVAPSQTQAQIALFTFGVLLLVGGLSSNSFAQVFSGGGGAGLETRYNDVRIANSVNAILTYLEGTFGALVMVAAGLGAILSAAFGQYKAALGCLVVAVGAFILRSFLGTFFNDTNVRA